MALSHLGGAAPSTLRDRLRARAQFASKLQEIVDADAPVHCPFTVDETVTTPQNTRIGWCRNPAEGFVLYVDESGHICYGVPHGAYRRFSPKYAQKLAGRYGGEVCPIMEDPSPLKTPRVLYCFVYISRFDQTPPSYQLTMAEVIKASEVAKKDGLPVAEVIEAHQAAKKARVIKAHATLCDARGWKRPYWPSNLRRL